MKPFKSIHFSLFYFAASLLSFFVLISEARSQSLPKDEVDVFEGTMLALSMLKSLSPEQYQTVYKNLTTEEILEFQFGSIDEKKRLGIALSIQAYMDFAVDSLDHVKLEGIKNKFFKAAATYPFAYEGLANIEICFSSIEPKKNPRLREYVDASQLNFASKQYKAILIVMEQGDSPKAIAKAEQLIEEAVKDVKNWKTSEMSGIDVEAFHNAAIINQMGKNSSKAYQAASEGLSRLEAQEKVFESDNKAKKIANPLAERNKLLRKGLNAVLQNKPVQLNFDVTRATCPVLINK
jgi:hypothetical protein